MAITAALIAAAGSIGGAALGASKNKRQSGPALVSIANSPLFQQLQLLAMMGIGQQITPASLREASPLGTLLGSAGDVGLTRKGQKGYASILDNLYRAIDDGRANGLSAGQIVDSIKRSDWWNASDGLRDGQFGNEGDIRGVMDPFGFFGDGVSDKYKRTQRGRRALKRLTAASGYNDLEELIEAQLQYETQAEERLREMNETSGIAAQGRNDALRRIAGIQSDFVAPTEEEFRAEAGEIEAALRGQIEREARDQQDALSVAAQVGRYNPGGGMGRIGEWQSQANLQAGPDSVARALQLLSGQQSLQSNALGALQGSLAQQDQGALALLGLLNGNSIANNQIAAQMAGVNAQVNAQNAQLWQQGLSGAAGGIGNAMLLNQLMGNNGGGGSNQINATGAQTLMNLLNANHELGSRG
jgi:hypothetical protein